jgi:hypothetical protein
MDCGCKAVTATNEFGTNFKMEQITYECGAEYRSFHSRNDNTARVHQCGCTMSQD